MSADEAPAEAPIREIALSVEISAPGEDVWAAIATGDGIKRWFAPFASVEEGEGGTVRVAWAEGADWPNRITVWKPGDRLQMVDLSDPAAVTQGTAITVDYRLSTAQGKTLVHLVNSGLPGTPDFDDHYHMMTNGWGIFPLEPKARSGTPPRCRPARDQRTALGDGQP